ncbi:hypothetical protein ACFQLX_13870 [Streptomyces polyrhachis]|uniref:DNA-binding phage zinc finger domain-containing protein n=1 Tax=Streptomyces polyrhachis TaxID=1282885 RepID=A0ABW2GJA6_9ACTN
MAPAPPRPRSRIRGRRLENFRYEPADHDETIPQYLARYRGQVHAAASGRIAPPAHRDALASGPAQDSARELDERVRRVGRTLPATGAESLADQVRRSGPLGAACPTCRAAVGGPCKAPGGRRRTTPHLARTRASAGERRLAPAQRTAAEDRIRAASQRALDRLGTRPAEKTGEPMADRR